MEPGCKHLDLARESRTKHESLSVTSGGHVLLFDDATNLRFKSHVKHAISFIKNQKDDYIIKEENTFQKKEKKGKKKGKKKRKENERAEEVKKKKNDSLFDKEILPRSMISVSRPGVATRRSQVPRSSS